MFEVRTDDGVALRGRIFESRRSDAPTVVLHHGLASTQHIFDLMLPHLRDLRVVTFDARGHGRSGKPSARYGFEHTVRDLLAVTRTARAHRPIVAGHSWGAMVALEAAARRPRALSGICLIDGGLGALGAEMSWAEVKTRLAPPHLAGIPLERFRDMISSFWGDALEVTPEVERIVLANMRVRRDGTIAPFLSRANHFKILRAIWEQRPSDLHPQLRVPAEMVLAHDGGDPGWDEGKRASADAIRGSGAPTTFTWMRGVHDLPLQHPAALAADLRRFVRRAVR